jgi:ferrous iron transport protein B
MHFLGLALAIPIAYLFSRLLFVREEVPFILELPPYRMPQARDVLWRVWERGSHFLIRAGTVIFCMSIIIWALSYFPHSEEVADATQQRFVTALAAEQGVSVEVAQERLSDPKLAGLLERETAAAYMEDSYLGRFGKFVQPVFAPAGFDWKITVGVLASFPAREVIISTLGILYNLGGDVSEESSELMTSMRGSTWGDGQPVFTPLVAIGIMVFFALCMQCGATVAVIAQESSKRWALFSFVYMTLLAWTGAVLVYQVGSLFAN